MYDIEKQKPVYLMILFCNTVLMIALIAEAILLGWETGAALLLFLGLVACWVIHFVRTDFKSIQLWLYTILTMLGFFYYGIHEISIYSLALVSVMFILMYTATEDCRFVRFCTASYYLTMCYDLVFLSAKAFNPARTVLHFVLVFIAERLSETIINRQRTERNNTMKRISQLEEANQSAEDFLGNVSHELRTPINAVMGISSMMLKKETAPEKIESLHSIQIAGNRLFGRIEDILNYSEIDTGRIGITEGAYILTSVINDVVTETRIAERARELELIFDIDAGIPALLSGDERKIKKIIRHLIDNALKFTKKGGAYVRIYALKKTYGINLCIRVSDTGIGIAEEELGKITEKFFQSGGGKARKSDGLGLGLSIVYGLVSAMGGFMQLESVKDGGTTVSVSIPQQVLDETPCMKVTKPENLSLACYLMPEKYEVPEIRDYYNETISHMVRELGLTVHRVFTPDELERLVASVQLTHLVVGQVEYEERVSYFEGLDPSIEVITVVDDQFTPIHNSRVKLVRKPFNCMPIVNILNSQAALEGDTFERRNMVCPGVRILIVDDEPMNLLVAEGIFKGYQMVVKTAGSGMESITICKEEDFDLIFLDHMMPEMDGVETLKRLRNIQEDLDRTYKIIAFTANDVSGAKEMFLREGFDEFISKPVEEQELKRVLRKMLPKESVQYVQENYWNQSADAAGTMDVVGAMGTAGSVDAAGFAGYNGTARFLGTVGSAEPADNAGPAFAQKINTEAGQSKTPLERLKEKGFHTESGLRYCGNDETFYEKVLTKFAEDAARKRADIETAFRGKELKDYGILAHALKSSSRMVGADDLSLMSKDAEDAAKNEDMKYVQENHAELIEKYRETVSYIQEVFGLAEPESQEETAAANEIAEDELLRQLKELDESLSTFEAEKAEKLIVDISGFVYQGEPVRELLHEIRQDVENFELDAASEKVQTLLGNLEGGKA